MAESSLSSKPVGIAAQFSFSTKAFDLREAKIVHGRAIKFLARAVSP